MSQPAHAFEVDPRPTKLRRAPLHRLRRLVIIFVATLATCYVALCAAVFMFQRHLLYFPSPEYRFTPTDFGLAYEEATLTTIDGEQIAAWYVPHPAPRATILYFHGNGENLGDCAPTFKSLHQLDLAVVAIDYRGYGRSSGTPSEGGTQRDAAAAWSYLTETRRTPASEIIVVGRSLGGGVAVDLAQRSTPAGLVLECTFTSVVEIGQREYPFLPVTLLATNRYSSINKISDVNCPILQFHGRDDQVIPLENAKRLYDAAPQPRQFVETGGDHNTAGFEYDDSTRSVFSRWLDSLASTP